MGENGISIIIPHYNHSDAVNKTLESITNQTFANWECFIVDDKSELEHLVKLRKLVAKDKRFHLLCNETPNKGASVCRNLGIEKASFELIFFIDADDWISADSLQQRFRNVVNFPDYDFWIYPTSVVREDSSESPFYDLNKLSNALHAFIRHEIPWTIMGVLWKKKVLNQLQGFDIKYPRFQDPELHCRALLGGYTYRVFAREKPDNFYNLQIKTSNSHVSNVLFGCRFFIEDVLEISRNREDHSEIVLNLKELYKKVILKYVLFTSNDIDCSGFMRFHKQRMLFNFFDIFIIDFVLFMRSMKIINYFPFKSLAWRLINYL